MFFSSMIRTHNINLRIDRIDSSMQQLFTDKNPHLCIRYLHVGLHVQCHLRIAKVMRNMSPDKRS